MTTMEMQILPTKLYIPSPLPNLVARPRLLDRLDAGLQAGHRLTVVSAPAGSGKTTLIADWIYSPARAVASRAVAWLSLDSDDNDPARFLVHFIAALRQIDPAVGRAAQSLLGTPQLPPLSGLVNSLIADLTELATPGVIVLDDYQFIEAEALHEAVMLFLRHQPAQLHVVVITRQQPPFPLARMRVRHEVTEIGAQDLRFTQAEAQEMLSRSLPEGVVAEALGRTEGWAAGLQLLSLAAHRVADRGESEEVSTEGFLGIVRDSGYAAEYLVSEVVSHQPEEIQAFLRATSVLDVLTGSLCDAVVECEGSSALLARLAAENLFVVPLDDRGIWYRYHRLFAEVLADTLAPSERLALHRRALGWYEKEGQVTRAIHHALLLGRLGCDWADAERLIRLYAESTARRGEVMMVKGWLDALPASSLAEDALLATLSAWILAMTGDLTGADSHAQVAERCLSESGARQAHAVLDSAGDQLSEPRLHLGKLHALRSFIVLLKDEDNTGATAYADSALELLPPGETAWRILALWSRAEAQERLDHLSEAIDALWEAQRLSRAMRETLFAVVAEGGLVKLLNDHGRRRDALALCEDALSYYRDEEGRALPLAGFIHSQLGVLHYEANDLQEAVETHERALALGASLGLDYELVYQRALAAPTWFAMGDAARALAVLRTGYQQATQSGYADADWFLAWETNIRLWQGDVVFARHWARQAGLSPDDSPRLLRIEQHLTYARFLVAEGRYADARHWLSRLEMFAREHGLYRWLITVNVIQARVAEILGDRENALALLTQAIQAAEPEGYVRAFLIEGPRVVTLLAELRYVAPAFVDRVRDAAAQCAAPTGLKVVAPLLVEPLTERELEVLRLIAGGASNQEIAETLVIAPGTVKRHTNHIYGKLQVHRRTEAVARARELGLL